MLTTKDKIVDRQELAHRCEEYRRHGLKIVTCNGSFDLFHYGHLCFLEEAKAQADILVVGLNSDSSIKQYKSPARPVITQSQRAALLSALQIVDLVHIFDETVPMPFLEVVRPDVHVNGAEYGADCIEAPLVKSFGGRIHLMPKVDGLSTTGLIARIKEL